MNKSYRLKTSIGSDQVLNVNLKQDVDIYEILSLKLGKDKLNQNGLTVDSMYKTFSANYGVIIGRVLANDAFGVPNAKISVFIPLSKEDRAGRRDLRAMYPFNSVTDVDKRNVKYNTLPNYRRFECHQPVGSFPNKRLVLDDDSVLELYDKYYKYTTVTNSAGDYMLFGIPTGEQILHMDVDLSDIGILSQEPRDFIYKGYSPNLFESPTQFKNSTNLDDLPQIQNQSTSVTVYPLWGDKNNSEIAITRKDITLQYKFEPTCVFIGSVITDNGNNSISHNCVPDEKVGEADQLVASKGNIEMIRKTVNDTVEEFQIKGNQLIDADGTWCYQIPMNLDYVGTDEYGNIVPISNPNKGIPTRTRVRFRITLDESGSDTQTTHKARYLIPNNPDLYESDSDDLECPRIDKNIIDSVEYDVFKGTWIDDNTFVIDRENGQEFAAGKITGYTTDDNDESEDNNDDESDPQPLYEFIRMENYNSYYEFGTFTPDDCFRDLYWNKVYSVKNYIPRVQMSSYENTTNYLAIKGVNKNGASENNLIPYNKLNANFSLPAYTLSQVISNEGVSGDWYNEFWLLFKWYNPKFNTNEILEAALDKLDGISLDFYNDWLNGCLYFPSWLWQVRKKKSYKKGESVYESTFCECRNDSNHNAPHNLYIFNNGSLFYRNNDLMLDSMEESYKKYGEEKRYTSVPLGSKEFVNGIIVKKTNIDGADAFYYTFGNRLYEDEENDDYYKYARLFSTDIILLGSLKDCDLDGVPKVQYNLPSTTAIMPDIGRQKNSNSDAPSEENYLSYNGMNWGNEWYNDGGPIYKYNLGNGLFFGINIVDGYVRIFTDIKTCINVERLCELGVTLDADYVMRFDDRNNYFYNEMDGLITRREINDVEARSLFATLNYNKLIGTIENYNTGYKKYNLINLYPNNFDGRLEEIASVYTVDSTSTEDTEPVSDDYRNKDYLDFRFGNNALDNDSTTPNTVSYRGLTVLFNRKKKKRIDVDFSESSEIVGPNGDKYAVGDGAVRFNKPIRIKRRHFYGFNTDDSVHYEEGEFDKDMKYVFPLYDNSFYFYFGINQGSTAIDKFYEQFYSECNTDLNN